MCEWGGGGNFSGKSFRSCFTFWVRIRAASYRDRNHPCKFPRIRIDTLQSCEIEIQFLGSKLSFECVRLFVLFCLVFIIYCMYYVAMLDDEEY